MAWRSAWIPAPPPESEPAIVYTMAGFMVCDDNAVVVRRIVVRVTKIERITERLQRKTIAMSNVNYIIHLHLTSHTTSFTCRQLTAENSKVNISVAFRNP